MRNVEMVAHTIVHKMNSRENHDKSQEELIKMVLVDLIKFERESISKGKISVLKPMLRTIEAKLDALSFT